jgi:hypothetical protein
MHGIPLPSRDNGTTDVLKIVEGQLPAFQRFSSGKLVLKTVKAVFQPSIILKKTVRLPSVDNKCFAYTTIDTSCVHMQSCHLQKPCKFALPIWQTSTFSLGEKCHDLPETCEGLIDARHLAKVRFL